MKYVHTLALDKLCKQFSEDQIEIVMECCDEIRGLKRQFLGYDDDEIEAAIGDYLDEMYEGYCNYAIEHNNLSDTDFDYIYRTITDIPVYRQ